MPVSVPWVFTPGTVISSAQVNADFAAIVNYINGLVIPTTPVSIPNGGTGGTSPQTALTNLGLGNGTIIACSFTSSAGSPLPIVLNPEAQEPTVTAYADGLTLFARVGGSPLTGPFTINYTVSPLPGLGAKNLYASDGLSLLTTLAANQIILVTYDVALGGFVLMNSPPPGAAAARFAIFTANGTLTVPPSVNSMTISEGSGGGGGGGANSGAGASGGGGGGGAAAVTGFAISVIPGHLLAITVGAGGAAGSGGAGGAGGNTIVVDSTTATTLTTLNGGGGGGYGTGTSTISGGAAGGAGGEAGQPGNYFTAASLTFGGSGGGCLIGGGAPGTPGSGSGVAPGGFGGGGSGAAASGSGGAGAGGKIRLDW